jgi:hypothetical protein
MMDGPMFPEGSHLCDNARDYNFNEQTQKFTRLQRPPKYYFIDFGISRRYNPEDRPPLEPPIGGGDKSVPEFRHPVPCDPFPTDIYYMGNFIRKWIIMVRLSASVTLSAHRYA